MQKFLEKYEKYAAIIFFILMILCLIPMAFVGAYNHPLGDDFHYGYRAIMAWKETGNVFQVLKAAVEGTVEQFYIWQGTYSAMFLMHIPPQVWGDWGYKIYPAILLVGFSVSVFYLMHVLMCKELKASKNAWIAISSMLMLVFVEQVPLCGETIYWYNGSLYYTGFLACTFVFWGMIIELLRKYSIKRIIVLSLLALFIAGGNYASLLPTMIIFALLILYYLYLVLRKASVKKTLVSLCVVFGCLLIGFTISVLAPGNAIRQATSWKISPVTAVLKSIYQNLRYCIYWNGIWSALYFVFVTPIYIRIVRGCTWKFRYPIILCGLMLGIYCSSSCPTFYAQNNGGAARVFCLVYYMMILTVAMVYFYLLGAVCRYIDGKKGGEESLLSQCKTAVAILVVMMLALTCCRSWKEAYVKPNSLTAVQIIVSGDGDYYEAQYRERVAMLMDPSVKTVEFEPYDVPAEMNYFLHLGDLSGDANHDVNKVVAEIYGKDFVRVK